MALQALQSGRSVRFEDGTYDIRKFQVRTAADDTHVGSIQDVLVDDRGRARYLCVELDGKSRHILVPTGQTHTDQKKEVLWIDGMKKSGLSELPNYSQDPSQIDDKYERDLTRAYGKAFGNDRYAQPDYRGRGWGGGKHDGKRSIERVDRLDDIAVAEGEFDPRGWEAFGHDGQMLGEIDHLIGDTSSMKVIYLVLTVDKKLFGDDRQILVPAGHVDLEKGKERVIVSALDKSRIEKMPKYEAGKLNADTEQKISQIFSEGYTEDRRYDHPRYADEGLYGEEHISRVEEELNVGKKQKTGSVDVKKHVETEHVQEPVTVQKEVVEVERRPAGQHAKGDSKIGEEEIHIPVTKEELVVEKRPVVQEEIVVRKRTVDEEQFVDEKVRRERVEVQRHSET